MFDRSRGLVSNSFHESVGIYRSLVIKASASTLAFTALVLLVS